MFERDELTLWWSTSLREDTCSLPRLHGQCWPSPHSGACYFPGTAPTCLSAVDTCRLVACCQFFLGKHACTRYDQLQSIIPVPCLACLASSRDSVWLLIIIILTRPAESAVMSVLWPPHQSLPSMLSLAFSFLFSNVAAHLRRQVTSSSK